MVEKQLDIDTLKQVASSTINCTTNVREAQTAARLLFLSGQASQILSSGSEELRRTTLEVMSQNKVLEGPEIFNTFISTIQAQLEQLKFPLGQIPEQVQEMPAIENI